MTGEAKVRAAAPSEAWQTTRKERSLERTVNGDGILHLESLGIDLVLEEIYLGVRAGL